MSNFGKDLGKASDEELYNWVNQLDFRVVPLASDELTRRALKKTRDATKSFNKKSSEQTEKVIFLTKWIVGLTIIMTIGLIIQIFIAIKK